MYLARECRLCGRQFHARIFWHLGAPTSELCEACYYDAPNPANETPIRHLLPHPCELSPEPVADWSAVQVIVDDGYDPPAVAFMPGPMPFPERPMPPQTYPQNLERDWSKYPP